MSSIMKKSVKKRLFTAFSLVILMVVATIFYFNSPAPFSNHPSSKKQIAEKLGSGAEHEADRAGTDTEGSIRAKMNMARYKYFFRLMRDPATNSIPPNIRSRELRYAETLPTARQVKQRAKSQNPTMQAIDFNWHQTGPFDVGGRTRALAVDRRNPNTILAGGVSGGMWKSTDGGSTWTLTTPNLDNLSVTDVTQDPNSPDTWYYVSGEYIGNSASATGNVASYYGTGIFRSTDNGDSWTRISSTNNDDPTSFDSQFDFMSRIKVHPSGTVYVASNGFGIIRSPNGNDYSNLTLGGPGYHAFADVDIASDGKIIAVLSTEKATKGTVNNHPGIFLSKDNGQSWSKITPNNFPGEYGRSVVSFADSTSAYVLTKKINSSTNQGVSFFYLDLKNGTAEDRSANLPDFRDSDGNGTGYMNMQNGYNMVLAVKPDNPDFVIVGGTNLFRSTDGFATKPSGGYDGTSSSQKDQYWIGGYNKDNGYGSYSNHHPDQHAVAFSPNNPNQMWSGHDGGLSYTGDVTASAVTWTDMNNGYITSQFYSAALPVDTTDTHIMGGAQDNGTPYFSINQPSNTRDISAGDGGYAYFSTNYLFVEQQNGHTIRWRKDWQGYSFIFPSAANDQIFIHPYAIDPNDENVIYYPQGDHLWRNTQLDQVGDANNGNNSSGITSGWDELSNLSVGSGYLLTALSVSKVPGNILYFAGYADGQRPVLKRLANAKTATNGAQDISYGSWPSGAYIKDIAINPVNANEVVVVMSNYNITGLYHTTDGGQSWESIEGNLTGNSSTPGPSLRSATIIPAESGTIYLVGTTTGLYSTQLLDGNNTMWGQEASNQIGHALTEDLASRVSDGDVAAGTHGRGMLLGDFQGNTNAPFIVANPLKGRAGETVTLTANDFTFSNTKSENVVKFGTVPATVLSATASELKVKVPRGVLGRQTSSNSVIINVRTNNQSISTSFQIVPPETFTMKQNYPNPFNPSTNIPFDLSVDSNVYLAIYDMSGRRVLQPLRDVPFNAGTYNQKVDLSGLASGVYIYRLIAKPQSGNGSTHIKSKKLTFIK